MDFYFIVTFFLGQQFSLNCLLWAHIGHYPQVTLVLWIKSELWLIFVGNTKYSFVDCASYNERRSDCVSEYKNGETIKTIWNQTSFKHSHFGVMKVTQGLGIGKLPRLRHTSNANIENRGTVEWRWTSSWELRMMRILQPRQIDLRTPINLGAVNETIKESANQNRMMMHSVQHTPEPG